MVSKLSGNKAVGVEKRESRRKRKSLVYLTDTGAGKEKRGKTKI
jgi:hypothetical protein